MIKTPKPISGISKPKPTPELPTLLPAPALLPLATTPEIVNVCVYVIHHYGNSGIALLINRHSNGDIVMRVGDWSGNLLDLNNDKPLVLLAKRIIADHSKSIIELMSAIKLPQAQFFFSESGLLVDIQTAINKLSGPGMIKDLFGTLLPTQIIDCILQMPEIDKFTPTKPMILKPNRFRLIERPGGHQPLYVTT